MLTVKVTTNLCTVSVPQSTKQWDVRGSQAVDSLFHEEAANILASSDYKYPVRLYGASLNYSNVVIFMGTYPFSLKLKLTSEILVRFIFYR